MTSKALAGHSTLTTAGNRTLIILIVSVVFIRLAFIPRLGLMPQDAYYTFYGEHPALSYFDHPPAIAYLLKSFIFVFGKEVYAIKLADTFITLLFLGVFFRLALCFLSKNRALRALILLLSTLMITVLSLVSTPDVPLMLFWSLSLYSLYRALFREEKSWWLAAGLCMGLAFNSKYTGVFLPFGVLLYFLIQGKNWKHLRSGWFWGAVLIYFATVLPVIWWNVDNHFASFRFQSESRMSGLAINPLGFLGVVGHQAALLLPILFVLLIWMSFRLLRKFTRLNPERKFLFCFFLPVFAGFFLLSLFYWIKLNWMMPSYIAGILLISPYIRAKALRWQWWCSLVIHIALAVEVLFYPVPVYSDDTWLGWDDLAREVASLKKNYPEDFIFSADDYKTSAILNFYLPGFIYSQNVIGRRALQFDFVGTDLSQLSGRDALFINSIPDLTGDEDERGFRSAILPYFDAVVELEPLEIREDGELVRKFLVYRCVGYHPERLSKTD